ncbi:MAG: LacI family DNA-binding transcriptional regulator [Acidimicrobiales bacterium]
MGQRTNLEEVGRLAGVSRSTVSRVVNGEPNVSVDAIARVKAAIEATGYRPHAAARSLASKRTGVVGLVIPSAVATLFDDPYFGRLILGASGATNSLGLTLTLFLFEQESDEHSIVSRVVDPGLVDGVIVTATTMGDPLIDHLNEAEMPFVVVGRPDDDSVRFSVDADNRGGARMATKHLISLGRQRLGMIAPPSNTTAGVDRRLGFVEAIESSTLDAAGQIEQGGWTETSGRLAMEQLIETGVDGVFVGSDRMALGALQALRQAGLRCPDDVAVVSFDGLLPTEQASPTLTSVVQDVTEVGARAALLLKSVIDNEATSAEHVVFPTRLTIGESCGAGAVE